MSNLLHGHAGIVADAAKTVSYSTSVGLMASATADFMNDNVGVIGGILGIATWVLNWVYKDKDIKLRARSLGVED